MASLLASVARGVGASALTARVPGWQGGGMASLTAAEELEREGAEVFLLLLGAWLHAHGLGWDSWPVGVPPVRRALEARL